MAGHVSRTGAMILISMLQFSVLITEAYGQNEVINKIRSLYNISQKDKPNYTKTTLDGFYESTEGQQVIAYKDNKEVCLIEVITFGHTGKSEEQYYFNNGKLYFAFTKSHNYNTPISLPSYDSTKTSINEHRYYFWENKMIRYTLPNGTQMNINSSEFANIEEDVLDNAVKILKRFEK
ncbi:hypothetical protein BXY85_0435 [Roseivirga pacifica]|uniref:Uncharacterized protein n=1 Tax=Roseivirga pacifica TaxID=1267423 RepID=A0A1I0RS38_9BACT|nr:hypothetical protein [Roseivirga pacifica]RKQ49446.1 hypothetical protein BXY85_0435 [Roseivirga pacifica]SEW44054.1 hypothetical protein SAMN05216290_4024 [Roseivirga pacifica]